MDLSASFRRTSILSGPRHTSVFQRFVAKGIDLTVITAVYFLGKAVWPPIGVFAAVILSAVHDALGNGQSVGKRIIGLRVVDEYSGVSCSVQNSILRNFPLVGICLFAPFPFLFGLAMVAIIPIGLLEVYLIINIESGVRLGDVMGNTLVVEYLGEPVGMPQ